METSRVLVEQIQSKIYLARGMKVMLSSDLANLYDVQSRALIQAVKRNRERFPADFMFQLNAAEYDSLRSHNVILKPGRGRFSKYLPYAFTQEGIAMLSSVLRSSTAIQVNIAIMRAFVKLRELMSSHEELARKIDALERRHDAKFKVVFNSIRELISAQSRTSAGNKATKRKIGFERE